MTQTEIESETDPVKGENTEDQNKQRALAEEELDRTEDQAQVEEGDDEFNSESDPLLLSEEELREALIAVREQSNELRDGYLRAKAEMENIRRRTQNEVINARKFAIEGFAQELLHVKDSLDQAALVELENEESEAVIKMNEGLGLTLKQLETAFSKFSVVEVNAAPGVKFDPEQHQAISMVPSDEIEANHIVEVMQKGFLLKDRLLRPAMVVVAS